ncbi:MAG: DUF2007 domain-containing protein [Anaerolineae bacterium]|nr:DUF2007 domain-containing protein [Anaerolineae bacterium]
MNKRKNPDSPIWMVVLTTYNIHEAHIIAGKLQSEDIPAMVHQQAGANAMGITVGAIGEINVLVRESDYETALAVIEPEYPDELSDNVDRTIFGDLEDDDE